MNFDKSSSSLGLPSAADLGLDLGRNSVRAAWAILGVRRDRGHGSFRGSRLPAEVGPLIARTSRRSCPDMCRSRAAMILERPRIKPFRPRNGNRTTRCALAPEDPDLRLTVSLKQVAGEDTGSS